MGLTDSNVPGWWQRLGLPGVVDIHTHFLPERMMRRVCPAGPGSWARAGRTPAAATVATTT